MMKPDVTIKISTHRRTARWAFEIKGPHYVARLGAGHTPSATHDTLAAIALTVALRCISPTIAARLVNNEQRKVRVRVESQCPTLASMCSTLQGSGVRKARAASEIQRALRKEIREHEVTFALVRESELKRAALFSKRMLQPRFDSFPRPTYVGEQI